MSQGFLESDEDYAKRIAREAAEKSLSDITGRKPSQGFFESTDDYQRRVLTEAAEREIEQSSGRRPSQGFFEGNDEYSKRVGTEASEQLFKSAKGRAASQGFFEGDDEYAGRVHREATEAYIKDQSGSSPSQGLFESDADYHRRITLEANERRSRQESSADGNDEPVGSTGGSGHSGHDAHRGSSGSAAPGADFDWRDIDLVIVNVQCVGCDQMEGHFFKAPGIRGCKICGYETELDRPWPEAVQKMIESGLYMRVGDGRTLIMTQDWASATELGSFPRLTKLWDLTRFDPPAPPDASAEEERGSFKFLRAALILAGLLVAALAISSVWDSLFGGSESAPVEGQSSAVSQASEAHLTPDIPESVNTDPAADVFKHRTYNSFPIFPLEQEQIERLLYEEDSLSSMFGRIQFPNNRKHPIGTNGTVGVGYLTDYFTSEPEPAVMRAFIATNTDEPVTEPVACSSARLDGSGTNFLHRSICMIEFRAEPGEYWLQLTAEGFKYRRHRITVGDAEEARPTQVPDFSRSTSARGALDQEIGFAGSDRTRPEREARQRHSERVRDADAQLSEAMASNPECSPDGEPCISYGERHRELVQRSHEMLQRELRSIRSR